MALLKDYLSSTANIMIKASASAYASLLKSLNSGLHVVSLQNYHQQLPNAQIDKIIIHLNSRIVVLDNILMPLFFKNETLHIPASKKAYFMQIELLPTFESPTNTILNAYTLSNYFIFYILIFVRLSLLISSSLILLVHCI